MAVTVGLVLPTFPQGDDVRWPSLASVATEAEAAGAEALWVCDHLFWHGPVLECLTALTVAATVTSTCTVGTAVLQLALRDPTSTAKALAGIQELSGGRLVVGVGAGIHAGEYEAAGADFRRRGKVLDEHLDRLQELWGEPAEPSAYQQLPVPAPIPLWVGGSSAQAMARVVRRGDGWMPMFVSPEGFRRRSADLDADLTAHGRRPADVARSLLVFVRTGSDGRRAREQAIEWTSALYRLPPDALRKHVVAGTPAECAERLLAFADAGVEHLCLFVADDDPVPHLAGLLPALAD